MLEEIQMLWLVNRPETIAQVALLTSEYLTLTYPPQGKSALRVKLIGVLFGGLA